ncbi:MAG: hypothetical protein QM597_07840 [Aeromicrobium sp.]|uniref:hypothetical protein n=1 Tax=Aeromicrobium sp. TaxID=1871063 RepID=UPI0039E3AFF2
MSRPMTRVALALLVSLALVGCSVPHQRDDTSISKAAIEDSEVDAVYDRYREVYNTAVDIGTAQPLSVVESDAVLAIDTVAFGVEGGTVKVSNLSADQVAVPRFETYPLWFVAVASDASSSERRVQVFARASSIDTWTLVASPQIASGVGLPELRTPRDASAVTVAPDDGRGMVMSADDAVAAYVAALGALPAASAETKIAGDDGFVQQMRESYQQNTMLPDLQFSQTWSADPVEYVLRNADGGALVFATLYRNDVFQVASGHTVTWPAGTAQAVLAPDGITGAGTVRFAHQVLVRVPPGSGDIEVIGQFGGAISVE